MDPGESTQVFIFKSIPLLLRSLHPLLFVRVFIKLSLLPLHGSLFLPSIDTLNSFSTRLLGDVHQCEGIFDEGKLDMVIKRRISDKRRSVIDLYHIGLAVFIKHHIDPQNVETHITQLVLWLAKSILMGH